MEKYFTITELTASDTAKARGIDNTPTPEVTSKLTALADNLLDPVRKQWGAPLFVNSGYRCPALNKAVGGVTSSQHQTGEAADITAGTSAKNKALFEDVIDMQRRGIIEFDQLIDESDYSWLHLSYREGNNRNQVLHL